MYHPPLTHTDRYMQRRDPDRAVKSPPLELPHRQDGDHMRRLAVPTANHRYAWRLAAPAKKAALLLFLHCALSLAVQCIVIGPVCESGVCNGRAVSEPYNTQRARSVCVSLSAFFIVIVIIIIIIIIIERV